MAACETNPFLLCDVLPSAVTSSGRRALHAFEDAFDGEPTLQRHPLRQLKLIPAPNYKKDKEAMGSIANSPGGQFGYMTRQWYLVGTGKKSTDPVF